MDENTSKENPNRVCLNVIAKKDVGDVKIRVFTADDWEKFKQENKTNTDNEITYCIDLREVGMCEP